MNTWVDELYEAIQGRPRPEDVAKIVVRLFPEAPHRRKWLIRTQSFSYMPTTYASATPLTKSANLLAHFLGRHTLSPEDTLGPALFDLLAAGRDAIGAPPSGALDFRNGRLSREARTGKGIEMSRRRYNKLFRLIDFLERERAHGDLFVQICEMSQDAKTGILRRLSKEEFGRDALTAMFVAYMGARMGLRSTFTVDPQQKAYDDLADALLDDLFESSTTNWYAVAHVFPRPDILARLTEHQKLILLSYTIQQMRDAAVVLQRTAQSSGIDYKKTCTVQRGQDSSSWNASAGAWNKARDTWLGLSETLGLKTKTMLPGKVPRLMAADVVAWQRSLGRPPHNVELVAADLPLPWEVLLNGVPCTEDDVRTACEKHGVHPMKSGWIAPRERAAVESWRPTPELVHGVAIEDPFLALVMRRLGWFSGPAKWERQGDRLI